MKSNRKKRIIAAVLCMVMVLTSNISALAGGEIFVDTPAAVEELSSEPAAVTETEPEVSVSDTETITETETLGTFSIQSVSGNPAGSESTAPSGDMTAEVSAGDVFSDGDAVVDMIPVSEAEISPAPENEIQVSPTPEAEASSTPEAEASPTPEAEASPTPEPEATPEAEDDSSADFGDGTDAEDQVLSGATELRQEFVDTERNVTQRVTANLPMGAFAAETSAVTMEVSYLDTDSANYVKSMMTELLPEGMQLGEYVFFNVEFKVNGETAEPLEPITVTVEGSNLTITDTKRANVFYLRKANPEVEGDKDELKEISQRAEVLERLQAAGESTENIEDYDLSEISRREDGTTDKIIFEGRKSTIYGCYVEEEKPAEDTTPEEEQPVENPEQGTEEANPETATEVEIISDDVNLRTQPDAEADNVAAVTYTGERYPLLETVEAGEAVWYKILYTNRETVEVIELYVDSRSAQLVEMEEDGNVETSEEVEEITELTFEDNQVSVSVSAAEEGVIPEGAKLSVTPITAENTDTQVQYAEVAQHVEKKIAAEEKTVAGFLAYDISFVDADGNKLEPNGEVKVSINYKEAVLPETITEDEAASTEITVLHLEEDEKGEVKEVVDMAQNQMMDVLAATEGNKVEKLELRTESFSAYVVTWSQEEMSNTFSGANEYNTTNNAGTGSILTAGDLACNNLATSNKWQIADEQYTGNEHTDKVLSSDGNVAVQKNVIATDIENEFLVYLSMDTKQNFREYFEYATYRATTSNNYHSEKPGTVVSTMTGNLEVNVSNDESSGFEKSGYFTILDPDGKILAEDIVLYWSQANNVTMFLKVSDSEWILLGLEVRVDGHNTVQLSEESMEKITEQIGNTIRIKSVEDLMGDKVEYIESVKADGTTVYNESTHTLTWNPALKTNPETSEERVEVDGEIQITKWSHNIAELVYKVRLNVEAEGFNSCANNMNSVVGDSETYAVNKRATLSYGDSDTIDFPIPYVRGLLYEFKFKKVDAADHTKALTGAEFELTNGEKTYSSEDLGEGYYQFTGIPWGSYTMTEKTPPEGYKLSDAKSWTLSVGYTLDLQDGTIEIDKHTHNPDSVYYQWLCKNEEFIHNDAGEWLVENKKIRIEFLKKGSDKKGNSVNLPNAEFELYEEKSEKVLLGTAVSDENGVLSFKDIDGKFVELSLGKTYYLKEIKAPDDYELLSEELKIQIDADGKVTVDESKADVISIVYDEDNDIYTVIVTNVLNPLSKLEVLKVSKQNNALVLSGAKFKLQKKDENGSYVDVINEAGQPVEVTTDENGKAYFTDLEDGEYQLIETEAPEGYMLLANPIPVTVNHINSAEGVVPVTVENEAVFSLPSTGGSGIFGYMIGGVALMMAAMFFLYKMRSEGGLRS